jgi:hypothetical protein
MEQAQSEGSGPATGEEANTPAPSSLAVSTGVPRREVNEAQRVVPTRRKLSDEQERELTDSMRRHSRRCPRSPAHLVLGSLPCTAWLSATEPRCAAGRPRRVRHRRSALRLVLAVAPRLPPPRGPLRLREQVRPNPGYPVRKRGYKSVALRADGSGFASWLSGSCKLGTLRARSTKRRPLGQSR